MNMILLTLTLTEVMVVHFQRAVSSRVMVFFIQKLNMIQKVKYVFLTI